MLSVSILGIKENINENLKILDKSNIDYFHIDIMDGIFVPNKTWNYEEINEALTDTKTKRDVHLMVTDLKKYIDDFIKINPEFITFHYEATNTPLEIIKYIKKNNIKVGISIKPNTQVREIENLLKYIDLVLVMSVEPGYGGQKFIEASTDKINELFEIRKKNNYTYQIEVDGGINDKTKNKVTNADILVVGSYITNSDNYGKQIEEFKKVKTLKI